MNGMRGKKAARVGQAPCGEPFLVGTAQPSPVSRVMCASTRLSGGTSSQHWFNPCTPV